MNFTIPVEPIQLRLVGGSTPNEGRVEVLYNDVWGTICDDNWDTQDATVVCRQLGLPTANVQALGEAHFGQGLGSTLLDEVNCSGSESSLNECGHNGWGEQDCSHSEDASVMCYNGELHFMNNILQFCQVSLFIVLT